MLALATAAGCGGSDEDSSSRDEALADLERASTVSTLETEMGTLVTTLSKDPSDKQRKAVQAQLASLDQRAADLIANAETTYEVQLEPVGESKGGGRVTLTEAEGVIAAQGTLDGPAAASGPTLAIHALPSGQGSAVCPPDDAATGSDNRLSSEEAEDFYGAQEVSFPSLEPSFSAEAEAVGVAPLATRAVVLFPGGPPAKARAPVACGLPVAVSASDGTADSELVAAATSTRGAIGDVQAAAGTDDLEAAKQASNRARQRMAVANKRVRSSVQLAQADLEEAGDVSAEDQAVVTQSLAGADAANAAVDEGFIALDEAITAEQKAEAEREAQRIAAQEAAAAAAAAAQAPAASAPSAPSGGGGGGPSVVIE